MPDMISSATAASAGWLGLTEKRVERLDLATMISFASILISALEVRSLDPDARAALIGQLVDAVFVAGPAE